MGRKAALMSELQTFVVVKLGERSLKEQCKPVWGGEALGQCIKQGVSFFLWSSDVSPRL